MNENPRSIRIELRDWHSDWSKRRKQLYEPLDELTAQTLFGKRPRFPFLPIMKWIKIRGVYIPQWLDKYAPYEKVKKQFQEKAQIGEFYGFWTNQTSNSIGNGERRENGRSNWKNVDELCIRLWKLYNEDGINPSEFIFRKLRDTDLAKIPRNQPKEIIPLETNDYFVYQVRLY